MPPRNRHSVQQPPRNDLKEISDELHEHIAVLASDEFAGRAPASKEEILTTSYIADQFKALGLAPGNGDSYLQEVQVTESITDANTALQVKGASFAAQFKYGEQVPQQPTPVFTRKPWATSRPASAGKTAFAPWCLTM